MALSSLSISEPLIAMRLTEGTKSEALRFLAQRPIQNVVMIGMIRDNGIESEFNRGHFYGCRNPAGSLVGVALIGHAVFIDARRDEALRQFAELAQQFPRTHMLMGETELIGRFWNYYYAPNGQPGKRLGREVLFELNVPPPPFERVPGLRPAEISDLERVLPVHASMALAESGVDPLRVDEDGFRLRCLRRIAAGRTWVLVEQDKLIFKAEIVSETPEVIYLEGVHVHPQFRGQGHGSRCLAQLSRQLLQRTRSITLLVNQEQRQAQRFYQRLGFVSRGWYDTIFLQNQTEIV
ncbi:MAG TPA: GNAT family N-acetyltransferase [Pyrinomonadaceae bacterium]|nr:GNAT family N-acetyltransferase [Pyrinomonadaceae bacterium]